MSHYDWEEGEYVIPSNQWAAFKKTLREAYNRGVQNDLALFAQAVEKVKKSYKSVRGVDWKKVLWSELDARDKTFSFSFSGEKDRYEFKMLDVHDLIGKAVVVASIDPAKPTQKPRSTLRSLMKKDFPLATNKTMTFRTGGGSIAFDEARRVVKWAVSENNHACEEAHDSGMGQAFFSALSKIQWSRGSGGFLLGNDEYNRDQENEREGGGGSYLKSCFGPLGEKALEERSSRSVRRPRRRA